jgi:hypothetical protein
MLVVADLDQAMDVAPIKSSHPRHQQQLFARRRGGCDHNSTANGVYSSIEEAVQQH